MRRSLGGQQYDRFVDHLDSASLDASREICDSVKITDVFEALLDSQAPTVPNAKLFWMPSRRPPWVLTLGYKKWPH
jgi:hypothetical protein